MMAFQGYLLKCGRDIFPNAYIQVNTFDSNPSQVEDIKAYRDENSRNLTRITAAGRKSAFSFKTRDNLHLKEVTAILNFFKSHYSVPAERKLSCTYWNDEDMNYKTANFYIANYKFTKKAVTANDIIYAATQFDFVEY